MLDSINLVPDIQYTEMHKTDERKKEGGREGGREGRYGEKR